MKHQVDKQKSLHKISNSTSRRFINFSMFLILTSAAHLVSATVRAPQLNLGQRPSTQTEGTICTDCAVRAPQSSIFQQLGQLQSGTERIFDAAYHSGNGDRSTLNILRNKRARGEFLTVEERAILQAADRVGRVVWPNCVNPDTQGYVSGNAFLVQIDGRDAIVTSAHLIKDDNGNLRGTCSLDDFRTANFMPNASYYEQTGPAAISNEVMRQTVSAQVDRRFGDFSNNPIQFENDWMILFLDQQISSQPAPNITTPRGFIQFARQQNIVERTSGYIIGIDGRQTAGVTTYQQCETVVEEQRSYNACDTAPGSSGSFVGTLEDGELRFQGINNRNSRILPSAGEHPVPDDYRDWNHGVSSDYIIEEIQRVLGPINTEA